MFAGTVPSEKERKRYAEGMYIVKEIRQTSETEGELRVDVLDGAGNSRGEMTWTVVQEEGRWKLKAAPLP